MLIFGTTPSSLTSFEASPDFLRLRAIALALRAGSRFAVLAATPPNLGGEFPSLPGNRINRQQGHERGKRMGAHFDHGGNIFAHDPCPAHFNESPRCFALLGDQVILVGDSVEILQDALAKRHVLAQIEKQAIELLGRRRRMFIKLEALVLESETSIFLPNLLNRLSSLPRRNEAHHAMA